MLLHSRQRHDGRFRENIDARHPRTFQIELDAVGDPGMEQFIERFARFDKHAALVRDRSGGLQQHEAALRCGAIETPALQVIRQSLIIRKRVVAA